MWLQNVLHYRRELWSYKLSDFSFVRKFLCPKYSFARRIFCPKFQLLIILKTGRENKRENKKKINRIPLKNFFNILKLTQNIAKMWFSCLPERFFAKKGISMVLYLMLLHWAYSSYSCKVARFPFRGYVIIKRFW